MLYSEHETDARESPDPRLAELADEFAPTPIDTVTELANSDPPAWPMRTSPYV